MQLDDYSKALETYRNICKYTAQNIWKWEWCQIIGDGLNIWKQLNFFFDRPVNLMCNHGKIYKWSIWKEICDYLGKIPRR